MDTLTILIIAVAGYLYLALWVGRQVTPSGDELFATMVVMSTDGQPLADPVEGSVAIRGGRIVNPRPICFFCHSKGVIGHVMMTWRDGGISSVLLDGDGEHVATPGMEITVYAGGMVLGFKDERKTGHG